MASQVNAPPQETTHVYAQNVYVTAPQAAYPPPPAAPAAPLPKNFWAKKLSGKCCCCFNLRTGTILIAVLMFIGSLIGVAISVWGVTLSNYTDERLAIYYTDTQRQQLKAALEGTKTIYIVTAILYSVEAAIGGFGLWVSIAQKVQGVKWFAVAFAIWTMITIVGQVVTSFIPVTTTSSALGATSGFYGANVVTVIVSILIGAVISAHFWAVIWSYHVELKYPEQLQPTVLPYYQPPPQANPYGGLPKYEPGVAYPSPQTAAGNQ